MGQAPVVKAAYRPFNTQLLYLEENLIEAFGSVTRTMAPERGRTLCIAVTGPSATDPFSVMMTDLPPNLHYMNSGHVFPRFTYEPLDSADAQGAFDLRSDETDVVAGYRRVDNITDEALAESRVAYSTAVTKDDVFYYIYGLLHSPDYRTAFAADLKKMLPRIPKVTSTEDFRAFAAAGRELATLHIDYESVTPHPLQITGEPGTDVVGQGLYDWYRVDKMRFGGAGKGKDRSTVVYNSRITVAGIPEEAHEYLLGSRSAIEWILERYQVKTDKASGIVNDPNDWSREVGNPRYILDLLARIVTVSVETVRIVKALPPIDFGTA
jgi:predicted helicase